MPEHGIHIELETPRGTTTFNDYAASDYLRIDEFVLNAAVRGAVEAVPRRNGSIVPAAFRSGATPILKGTAKAASVETRTDMLDELRAQLVSILRADGVLRWTPSGKTTRRLTVRCLEDPSESGGFLKTFQAALVSTTAHVESDAEHVASYSSLDGDSSGDEFEFPFEFPMDLGAGLAAGTAVVENAGDTDAWPLVRVTGPVTNPTLVNSTTGDELALIIDIPAGSFLEVDMDAETVRMNADPDQNRIGSVDPLNGVFWPLVEGVNEVRLIADAHDVGHGAAIYWRDAYA